MEIADLLGVRHETVSRWWTAYVTGGPDALPRDRTGRPVGSGRTLADEPARRIQDQIDHHSPEELGIPSPLWSRRAVRDLIRQESGLTLPVRTVGEYLRRWGYTAKRPRRRARQQDPEEVREWLETIYPAIKQCAKQEGAEIPWCDETGVAADEHPRYGYARKGHPAIMEVPDRQIGVAVANGPKTTLSRLTDLLVARSPQNSASWRHRPRPALRPETRGSRSVSGL